MRLYSDEQSMADDRPVPWPCPSRNAFIRHRKMILDMVYNGPLYVFCLEKIQRSGHLVMFEFIIAFH